MRSSRDTLGRRVIPCGLRYKCCFYSSPLHEPHDPSRCSMWGNPPANTCSRFGICSVASVLRLLLTALQFRKTDYWRLGLVHEHGQLVLVMLISLLLHDDASVNKQLKRRYTLFSYTEPTSLAPKFKRSREYNCPFRRSLSPANCPMDFIF